MRVLSVFATLAAGACLVQARAEPDPKTQPKAGPAEPTPEQKKQQLLIEIGQLETRISAASGKKAAGQERTDFDNQIQALRDTRDAKVNADTATIEAQNEARTEFIAAVKDKLPVEVDEEVDVSKLVEKWVEQKKEEWKNITEKVEDDVGKNQKNKGSCESLARTWVKMTRSEEEQTSFFKEYDEKKITEKEKKRQEEAKQLVAKAKAAGGEGAEVSQPPEVQERMKKAKEMQQKLEEAQKEKWSDIKGDAKEALGKCQKFAADVTVEKLLSADELKDSDKKESAEKELEAFKWFMDNVDPCCTCCCMTIIISIVAVSVLLVLVLVGVAVFFLLGSGESKEDEGVFDESSADETLAYTQ